MYMSPSMNSLLTEKPENPCNYLTLDNLSPTEEELREEELQDNDTDMEMAETEDAGEYQGGLGNYINEIREYPLLTQDEELALSKSIVHKAPDAKTALDLLICSNLRLVVSIAKRFGNRGLDIFDLIQEGNLGLYKAAQRYDYRRGFRFSTYATWWIKQSISRALADKSRTIRLPVHVEESLHKIKTAETQLTAKLHRRPTIKEIAEEINMSLDKCMELVRVALPTASLDQTVDNDESSAFGDFIEDKNAISPEKHAVDSTRNDLISKMLEELTEREKLIICLRYGLTEEGPRTLEEIGQSLGITRERVRQIESKALMKLRRMNHRYNLDEYLN